MELGLEPQCGWFSFLSLGSSSSVENAAGLWKVTTDSGLDCQAKVDTSELHESF